MLTSKIFYFNLAADEPVILHAWQALDDYLEEMITRRRHMSGLKVRGERRRSD